MKGESFVVRPATERDQPAITRLVHSERLNPNDLDWRRFIVASDRSGVLGAVQLRRHRDSARELASLVVRRDARGRGVATRLIDTVLSTVAATRVLMITGVAFGRHYRRWGFRRIDAERAPRSVLRNFYFGTLVGGFLAFLAGRSPRRLAIFERLPPAGSPQARR